MKSLLLELPARFRHAAGVRPAHIIPDALFHRRRGAENEIIFLNSCLSTALAARAPCKGGERVIALTCPLIIY
jgi:hypothetical protein